MESSFPENLKASKEQSRTVIILFSAVETEMHGFSPRSLLSHCKSEVEWMELLVKNEGHTFQQQNQKIA